MENAQVIRLDKSSKCLIDCESHGYTIEGPALVVVIKEAAAETTTTGMSFGQWKAANCQS